MDFENSNSEILSETKSLEYQINVPKLDLKPSPFSTIKTLKTTMNSSLADKRRRISKLNGVIFMKLGNQFKKSIPEQPKILITEDTKQKHKVSSYSIMKTFGKVRKFVESLKHQIFFNYYRNLKKDHLDVINDLVVFSEGMEENEDKIIYKKRKFTQTLFKHFEKNSTKIFTNLIHRLHANIPIISNDNKVLIVWNLMIALLVLFFIVFVPIFLSFDLNLKIIFEPDLIYYFDTCVLVIFIFDLALKFNISYYENGNEVKKRKKIMINYIKSEFLFDVCSFLGVFTQSSEFSFLQIMIMFKILSFSQYLSAIQQRFVFSDFAEGMLKVLILMIKILYIAHILACLFNFISIQLLNSNYSNDSWIINAGLIDSSWFEKYFNAYYWVITTLVTVGYGDIVPKNPVEKFYCIIVMLIGSGIFAYNLNRLSNIFGDISKNEREYLANLKILNQMMSRKNINSELQNKVRNYFHYIYKKENKKEIEQENQLFNKLSNNLQNEIILNSYALILKYSQFFCKNFSEAFLQSIIFKMNAKLFMPDEIIFAEGEANPCIHFFTQGKAKIIFHNLKMNKEEGGIFEVKTGDTLGEYNFITREENKYSCKSTDFCSTYTITLKDFLSTLDKFPDDKEKFAMIKDNILLYQNYEHLYKNCKLCNSKYHLTDQCHFINIYSKREKLFYKIYLEKKKNVINERKTFKRKTKKRDFYHCGDVNGISNPDLIASSSPGLRLYNIKEYEKSSEPIVGINPDKENIGISFQGRCNTFESIEYKEKLLAYFRNQRPPSEKNLKLNSECLELDEKQNLDEESKTIAEDAIFDDRKRIHENITTKNLFAYYFDVGYNFSIYFPHNNPANVVKKKYLINELTVASPDNKKIQSPSNRRPSNLLIGKNLFKV